MQITFATGCFPYDVRDGVILLGCRGGCRHASFFFGRILWIQGGRVHGYAPDTRRRRSVALPPSARGRAEALYGNRHELTVTVGRELFSAPWPR